jgi:hypothetical protein
MVNPLKSDNGPQAEKHDEFYNPGSALIMTNIRLDRFELVDPLAQTNY